MRKGGGGDQGVARWDRPGRPVETVPGTGGVLWLLEGARTPSLTVGLPPHLLSDSGERVSWLLGAGPSGRVGSIISGA
jgi:hypothetical protein